jgi:hypothetical protein
MGIKFVRNSKTSSNEITGLQTVGSNRSRTAFGVIPAEEYSIGDIICFDSLASFKIYQGKLDTHEINPTTLEILPGTKLIEPLQLKVAAPVDISYVIHYVKGIGYTDAPQDSDSKPTTKGELLKIHII